MKSFISQKNEKLSKACLNRIGGLSYNVFTRLLKDKDIKVNGKRTNKDILIAVGDTVDVYIKEQAIKSFDIIYEDENVVVVNKRCGYLSENVFEDLLTQKSQAYFIHRLDRNTSGIMIFALNKTSEKELLDGFKKHTFIKEYVTEVFGRLDKKEDILTAYLVKDSEKALVKIYDKQVKNSVLIKTGYKVLEEKEETSVLSIRLYTGKTHQIRAHLAHIGHFVVGDSKYGVDTFNKKMGYKEQKLCAVRLTLKFEKECSLYYLNNKTFDIS